jgi:membrane protease YdiL (CAAX protease family)
MSFSILEFLVVFVTAILPQVLISFYPDGLQDQLGKIMTGRWRFLTALPARLGAILLILFIVSTRADGFHTIGLTVEEVTSLSTLVTAVFLTAYLLLIFVLSDLRSKKTKEQTQQIQQRTLAGLRYSKPKNFLESFAYFVDIWLAVIGEELVYRGYLILLLGRETGSYIPWVLLSVILSAIIHLYQGRSLRVALGHMIFAGLFIAAMLITGSVFAAIVPHLIYNTIWLIRAMRSLLANEVNSVSTQNSINQIDA